jgi:hypothetical protein
MLRETNVVYCPSWSFPPFRRMTIWQNSNSTAFLKCCEQFVDVRFRSQRHIILELSWLTLAVWQTCLVHSTVTFFSFIFTMSSLFVAESFLKFSQKWKRLRSIIPTILTISRNVLFEGRSNSMTDFGVSECKWLLQHQFFCPQKSNFFSETEKFWWGGI